MPALLQSSSSDSPAALARASMNSGLSRSNSDIPPVYLHKCTSVKRTLATRLEHGGYALVGPVVDHDREAVREYLTEAARHAGTDLTGLARRAGLAPSTLTRFVNRGSKYIPSTRTLSKIAEVSGYSFPNIGSWDRSDLLKSLRKLATTVGIDLNEAVVFGEAEEAKLSRAREWLVLIDGLTPTLQERTLEMLRGMNDELASQKHTSGPDKMLGRRRQG